jgi:hypothetical protein
VHLGKRGRYKYSRVDDIEKYKLSWRTQVETMDSARLPKRAYKKRSQGRREVERPAKR